MGGKLSRPWDCLLFTANTAATEIIIGNAAENSPNRIETVRLWFIKAHIRALTTMNDIRLGFRQRRSRANRDDISGFKLN